jgi:hypothetical protein
LAPVALVIVEVRDFLSLAVHLSYLKETSLNIEGHMSYIYSVASTAYLASWKWPLVLKKLGIDRHIKIDTSIPNT